MCNYYDAHLPGIKEGYLSGVKLNLPNNYQNRHKVFPTGVSPIIYLNENGEAVGELSHFKLVPSFANDLNHKYSTMNARDDSLLKKGKMWNRYFESQRCLVPAIAFYEHHTLSSPELLEGHDKKTKKVPYRISLKSTSTFCFAGLYNKWTDETTGEVKISHAIITTDPNETVRKIHNSKERMALILPDTAYDMWMGEIQKGKDLFDAGLFSPWPDEDMEYIQITKGFDHGVNDEELLHPVNKPIEL